MSDIQQPPTSEVDALFADARVEIDSIDYGIFQLIAERFAITGAVGREKAKRGIAVHQPARYEEVLRTRAEWAEELGVDPVVASKVIQALLGGSESNQETIEAVEVPVEPASAEPALPSSTRVPFAYSPPTGTNVVY